jgi:hypothetical protein
MPGWPKSCGIERVPCSPQAFTGSQFMTFWKTTACCRWLLRSRQIGHGSSQERNLWHHGAEHLPRFRLPERTFVPIQELRIVGHAPVLLRLSFSPNSPTKPAALLPSLNFWEVSSSSSKICRVHTPDWSFEQKEASTTSPDGLEVPAVKSLSAIVIT